LDYPTYLKEGDELEDQQRRQPAIVEVGYCVMAGNSDEGAILHACMAGWLVAGG
jgi:hypothetical protein